MKVLFLLDVPNLFYSIRDFFGKNARLDFMKLRRMVMRMVPGYSEIKSIAYFNHYRDDLDKVLDMLEHIGYETRVVEIIVNDDKLFNTDIDYLLVEEIEEIAINYDVVIIGSGDSDFVPICLTLKELGLTVGILAFPDSLSDELIGVADLCKILDDEVLFERRDN